MNVTQGGKEAVFGPLFCSERRQNEGPQFVIKGFRMTIFFETNLLLRRIFNCGGTLELMREPLLAGILSLLVPGLGQIYNGRIIVGIIWIVLTGFSWIGSAGLFGWVIHSIAAYCAYSYAKEFPVRT